MNSLRNLRDDYLTAVGGDNYHFAVGVAQGVGQTASFLVGAEGKAAGISLKMGSKIIGKGVKIANAINILYIFFIVVLFKI